MKLKKSYIILLIAFSLAPLFTESVSAQPPPPPPQDIPIDGGLGFLLAAGIAYGAKKLHSEKKDNELGLRLKRAWR